MTHATLSFWALEYEKSQFAWVSEIDEIRWMHLPILNPKPYTQFGM